MLVLSTVDLFSCGRWIFDKRSDCENKMGSSAYTTEVNLHKKHVSTFPEEENVQSIETLT